MIYLDYNATTPVDPAVIAALTQCLTDTYGNPSSTHSLGKAAKAALDTARTQVASLLRCPANAVLFLSGGTESINYVLKGMLSLPAHQRHIITSAIEHVAITATCAFLEAEHGFEITYVPVDSRGRVKVEEVVAAVRPATCLVTIMHANNEVGTVQPIAAVAAAAKARHASLREADTRALRPLLVHSDASQSVGKIPVHVDALGVDFLTVAGHKLYAPKGVGALYIRPGTRPLQTLMHGAGHENGLRAGTENIPYAVALGVACALAEDGFDDKAKALWRLRCRLLDQLQALLPDVDMVVNGPTTGTSAKIASVLMGLAEHDVLPNTLSIGLAGVQAAQLLRAIEGDVAASAGSACHSHTTSISAVLKAMAVESTYAMGTLRLSVGRYTTVEEVDKAATVIAAAVRQQLHKKPRHD
ncbi:Cysteine desulfurase [Achlya hypogyna]|uniref:cysteine desulfurase n=1 Tax=Achlya hypogyna TaxID=1202772 RepID=A0A1V9Z267_ACHHY|nr:Cysteine desulfurase [Achlya hypogyna]